jgi:hypothetical protein
MINRLFVKSILIIAQASTMIILLGYLITRSQLVVIPAFVTIFLLMRLKCMNCKTSFMSPEVYKHLNPLKFYDTTIIDRCPVCQQAMFE